MIRAVVRLFLGASLALTGCTSVPPVPIGTIGSSPVATAVPRRADQLVALVGTVGAMTLMAAAPDGTLRPLGGTGLPADAAWLSSDGSTLLVSTLAGGIVLDTARSGQVPAWGPGLGDLAGSHPLRAFGSLQPVSGRGGAARRETPHVALVEGDPGSGGPGRLIVESLVGTLILRRDLTAAAEGAPAWLPDGRIVVVVRNQADVAGALILDPSNGQLSPARAGPLRSVAIGGQTVASVTGDGAVSVGSLQGWLRGEPADPIPGTGPDLSVLQAQPSVAGDQLALVIADSAGDAASIRILTGAGGWHEIARFELPRGANRAVVSWLVAP